MTPCASAPQERLDASDQFLRRKWLGHIIIGPGFQRVEIKYSAPYPDSEKLQPLPPTAALGDSVNTLNANVERVNRLLFTYLDYAAVGRRAG